MPWQIRSLGAGLIFFAIGLGYLFLSFWPSEFDPNTKGNAIQSFVLLGTGIPIRITADVQLLCVVILAGGIGSFIHTATSFGDFVGNRKLSQSWLWWYLLKPFIGMSLAVVFYLVVRGGFLSGSVETGKLNVYGLTALAGMAGMFSKQATDKLSEVFNTLFRTSPDSGDSKRADDLGNPVPTLNDVAPTSIERETQNVIIALTGTRFARGAVVQIGGVNRETQFNDETSLTAKLLPEDVANEGELEVTVINPAPGGGKSTPLRIKVAAGQAPEAAVVALAEDAVDGCDVPITSATSDAELPESRGGVQS
jgi:hypothetical protein